MEDDMTCSALVPSMKDHQFEQRRRSETLSDGFDKRKKHVRIYIVRCQGFRFSCACIKTKIPMKTLTVCAAANKIRALGDADIVSQLVCFLDQTPLESNYLIQNKFTLAGVYPFQIQINPICRRSDVKLSVHSMHSQTFR